MAEETMSTRFDAESATLRVVGEIDYGQVDLLSRLLRPHAGDPITIDLSEVTYLPSAAIGVLVRARRVAQASGGGLAIAAAPGTIAATVLHTVGIV